MVIHKLQIDYSSTVTTWPLFLSKVRRVLMSDILLLFWKCGMFCVSEAHWARSLALVVAYGK
jgi:hypothetical protein